MIKDMCQISDKTLELLQKDIAEIKVALLGNEYNPDGGLLCRTTEIEKEVEKLKSKYDRIIWTVSIAGSIIAIIFNVAMQILDKFMK